jgi:hypothetical protein
MAGLNIHVSVFTGFRVVNREELFDNVATVFEVRLVGRESQFNCQVVVFISL